MALEFAVIVRLADPGAKDEGGSRRENHVVEVRRALDREVTESPYLAHQLSVFDNRQLVMGLSGMMVGGLRRTLNSAVNARDVIYTSSGRDTRNTLCLVRSVAFAFDWFCVYKGVCHVSLYIV